jgi:hypothetical protein
MLLTHRHFFGQGGAKIISSNRLRQPRFQWTISSDKLMISKCELAGKAWAYLNTMHRFKKGKSEDFERVGKRINRSPHNPHL